MPKSSTYPSLKALIISALVISLTACSSGTQNNQSSSDSTSPSNSQTTEAPDPNAPPVATAPATSSVGEVPQPEEVKFQESASLSGYVDTVNDSANYKQTIAKTQPIIITGWAVSRDQQQPADMVLITLKDNKSIISTAKVDGERQDVANALKQPSIAMSGWNVEIDPATLPSETVELQAWAYDTETKEAYPLNNTAEITQK